MKFTIEIYAAAGDRVKLLHRTTISAINPLIARKKAYQLLSSWKKRAANSARVLNAQGEMLYSWGD
jgi:hypothetical protein